MPKVKEGQLTVTDINDSSVTFTVDGFSITMPMEELFSEVSQPPVPESICHNVKINILKTGVPKGNLLSIKNALEARFYQIVE